MRKYILLLFTVFLSGFTFSQKGYFGKRAVLSIEGSVRPTIIYQTLFMKGPYGNSTATFDKEKTHYFAAGFNASFSYYFKPNRGVGINFAMTSNQIKTPYKKEILAGSRIGDYKVPKDVNGGATMTMQGLNISTFYIIPKFEFSTGDALPIGLVQSIGLGYNQSRIVQDYAKVFIKGFNPPEGSDKLYMHTTTYDLTHFDVVRGAVIQYGIQVRIPITRFMTFDIGTTLRFQLPNIPFLINYGDIIDEYGGDQLTNDLLNNMLKKSVLYSRGINFWDVRAGISFILF